MLDLYVNYDCDVACTNLFEELCRSLCRNAVPEAGPLTTLHVLSLEGVLAVVENMARRCVAGRAGGLTALCGPEPGCGERCVGTVSACSLCQHRVILSRGARCDLAVSRRPLVTPPALLRVSLGGPDVPSTGVCSTRAAAPRRP
jgi:hypothetical protein